MKTEDWDKLLEKYFDGNTTRDEEDQLRDHYAGQNDDNPADEISDIFHSYDELGQLSVSEDFWDKTEALLPENVSTGDPGAEVSRMNGWHLISRIAAVLLLTLGGFFAGTWYADSSRVMKTNTHSSVLAARFEQASASERIKLIQTEFDKSSENKGIERVLIQALNNDDNVNVRLAAAEALYHFRSDQSVRKALIRSLPNQTDPNVQITLIDMFVRLHEKKALPEMRVMLMKNDLNPVVRYKLEDGVGTLG